MLSQERLFVIMNVIKERTFVTIKELMDEAHASKSTVTRDLIELEEQGFITRERGGAVLRELSDTLSAYNEVPTVNKECLFAEAKQSVCEKAARNVKDGDCIYIDSGTTPTYLLPHLLKKRVRIVTSSTYLIRKIPLSFKEEIYLLGGQFYPNYDMSSGSMAIDMVKNFNFDHSFFSTNGVNADNGEVYIFDFQLGALKKEILKRSQRSYLLFDDSKFNIKAMCTWAEVSEFTYIYVNGFPGDKRMPDNFILC